MESIHDQIQPFIKESDFEEALIQLLRQHGWGENDVIMYPTEEQLVQNWADILYANNREIDRLGNAPLTPTEMHQVIAQVNNCSSPFDTNRFINGEQVIVKRDNPDASNCGQEVYLKIFDAKEICAGQSRYQIVRQPKFRACNDLAGNRRGDIMLLINGMPVIHIELKRSRVDVSQAVYQIKRYTHEGVFSSGIFSLIQIFVAMTPEETLFFANPGCEENFKPEYWFHWEDFNNIVVRDWKKVTQDLLSIPMAHQMVGYYTIADDKDKILKVLRSYQYYAVTKIADKVHKTNWDDHQHRGGYIWHTTGSGKTMTSFKAAQLVAGSGDADKVVFLMDRIELSIQSLDEYRGFAGDEDAIQDTENTLMLVSKLRSTDRDDRLIVTSIQKMANIRPGTAIPEDTIAEIGRKRLVFIIDECHRSVFGDMLVNIKNTFPRALLFGFTGTPVFKENAHHEIMTETLFGDMLHKYTIASGISDKNVLGFDLTMVNTYDEDELREKAAFAQIGIHTDEELDTASDEDKELYRHFMEDLEMPTQYNGKDGEVHKGIEYYLPKDLYQQPIHHNAVAADISGNWMRLSRNGKFHAILATQNITEAIEYYRLFKSRYPSKNVVSVFDNNIDNSDGGIVREDAIIEMLTDYNLRYGTSFQLSTYGRYKKDVAKRLAHKKPYIGIEADHSQQIDLLIVVTQMLTGYDSKWINTLYVDKVLKYVDVIQAFSRTNRLFGPDKPFGIIRYYAFPHTMRQNIEDALEVYVDRPLGVFVDKLEQNLNNINSLFLHIRDIFQSHSIMGFERLPDARESRNMFAQDFSRLTHLLEAAKLQGFLWEKSIYEFQHGDTYTNVAMVLDENTYLILLQRYRELFDSKPGSDGNENEFDYPIDTYITETGTGTIDAEYLNSRFERFVKNLYTEGPGSELTRTALRDLHKSFAMLSQTDQRTAIVIIHDIQSGDLHLENGKTIQDYISEYQLKELYGQIVIIHEATGLNVSMMVNILKGDVNERNINAYDRYDKLKLTMDMTKSRAFVSKVEGKDTPARLVMPKVDRLLRQFILQPQMRAVIISAYLNDDVTIDSASRETDSEVAVESVEETIDRISEEEKSVIRPLNEEDRKEKLKAGMLAASSENFRDFKSTLRPVPEIIDWMFFTMDVNTIASLDGVKMFLAKALDSLYLKESPTIVDKFVSFNLLVTKFEAYLKKLYYVVNGEEIKPQRPGDDVTWANVIHAFTCLWGLKYDRDEKYQQLYQFLVLMKGWRNDESHISPTASELEVDAAINICLTMYLFVTGNNISELENSALIGN